MLCRHDCSVCAAPLLRRPCTRCMMNLTHLLLPHTLPLFPAAWCRHHNVADAEREMVILIQSVREHGLRNDRAALFSQFLALKPTVLPQAGLVVVRALNHALRTNTGTGGAVVDEDGGAVSWVPPLRLRGVMTGLLASITNATVGKMALKKVGCKLHGMHVHARLVCGRSRASASCTLPHHDLLGHYTCWCLPPAMCVHSPVRCARAGAPPTPSDLLFKARDCQEQATFWHGGPGCWWVMVAGTQHNVTD